MILGFSSGCLYKTHDRLAKSTFDEFKNIGCNAIELVCVDDDELERLISDVKLEDLEGFEYISLHSPAIHNALTLELLKQAHEIFNFKRIVIHPDEVENWMMFERFDLPFGIENMDWQKQLGKYTESMQDIFSKFDAPMVLDLNHCFTNDPSMKLAYEMNDAFNERIKEIHLSGFTRIHEPLFQTKQIEIMDAISDKRLPIIIESGCESVEDVKREFEYVKSFLEKML